jgi:hypothetical protein
LILVKNGTLLLFKTVRYVTLGNYIEIVHCTFLF